MPKARTDLLFHRAGDAWVVIDPMDDRSLTLNPSAYWVLHHCDGQSDPRAIAEALAEMASIPIQQAEGDVEACLAQFRDLGLLTAVD